MQPLRVKRAIDDMGLPGKGTGEVAVITSSINAQVHIEIIYTFPSMKDIW